MWDLGSLTGDRTFFPCIARWILNKWTPREVPLPNLGLGMCRQELGLQSSCCLSGCMEGHGLPHLLQVRKLRSSLENHAGRESLPCLHWPHLEENMMADDRLCPPHPSGTSLTSYRVGGQVHMLREQLAVTSCVFKEPEIPILWAEAKQGKRKKDTSPPTTILGDSGASVVSGVLY